MRLGLLLTVMAFHVSIPHANGAEGAQFKGYVAVNRILQERLVKRGQYFELANYLDERFYANGGFGPNLLDLLGGYHAASLDSTFRNGAPNVISMVLWHVALSGLATDLAQLCDPTSGSPLREVVQDSVTAAFKPICVWPADSAKTDDVLMGVWLSLVSFDAPMSEFDAWRDFFRGPDYESAPVGETVFALSLAALSNPHFLLRK